MMKTLWIMCVTLSLALVVEYAVATAKDEKQAPAQDWWIQGGVILDPASRSVKQQDILIHQGRIAYLKRKPTDLSRVKRVDCHSCFLMPAFVDLHVHSSWGNPNPLGPPEPMTLEDVRERMVRAGVTSYLDLFGDEAKVFAFREKQKALGVGARFYAAGPMLTAPGGHGTQFGIPTRVVGNRAEAKRVIQDLAQRHPDVIKIAFDHRSQEPTLRVSTLLALLREAHKVGIPTVVHIGTWEDAEQASQRGATVITHLSPEPIPERTLNAMAKAHVLEIPTQTYQTDFYHFLQKKKLLDSPLLHATVSEALLQAYRTLSLSQALELYPSYLSPQRDKEKGYQENLRALFRRKIPLLVGTDSGAGDLGVFHGYSVHREMALWVEAGIPIWDVLWGATVGPKRFLKEPMGLAPGDKADFVILYQNPLTEIQNTETLKMVFSHGELAYESP